MGTWEVAQWSKGGLGFRSLELKWVVDWWPTVPTLEGRHRESPEELPSHISELWV